MTHFRSTYGPTFSPTYDAFASGDPIVGGENNSAAWTPLSLTGLQHYYVADNIPPSGIEGDNDIILIPDSKGAVDAVQATEANKPDYATSAILSGHHVSSHPSGETFVRTVPFTAISQPFTAFVVCSKSANDALDAVIGGSNTRWFFRFISTTGVELYAGAGGPSASFTSAINTKYGVVAVFNGTTCKLRINGVAISMGATDCGANTATDFTVGAEITGSGQPFHGVIAESGIISGDLTTRPGELAALEAWFGRY